MITRFALIILDSAVSGELERRGFRDQEGYHRLLVEADAQLNRGLPPELGQELRTLQVLTDLNKGETKP